MEENKAISPDIYKSMEPKMADDFIKWKYWHDLAEEIIRILKNELRNNNDDYSICVEN